MQSLETKSSRPRPKSFETETRPETFGTQKFISAQTYRRRHNIALKIIKFLFKIVILKKCIIYYKLGIRTKLQIPFAHSKCLVARRECATAFLHPWSKHEYEKSCLSEQGIVTAGRSSNRKCIS